MPKFFEPKQYLQYFMEALLKDAHVSPRMLAYTGIFFWFAISCALNLLNDPVRWSVPEGREMLVDVVDMI